MLRLSGTVYLKTFANIFLRRYLGLPIYHSQQMIAYSLSPHLSFTPNLRLISSSNHSRLRLIALLHSRFSGSLNLALYSFHIPIIITASLISSHFICNTAYYCLKVSENKPPSSFHYCLVGFYSHLKSPHSSSLLFSHLISSYVDVFLSLSFHFVRKSLSLLYLLRRPCSTQQQGSYVAYISLLLSAHQHDSCQPSLTSCRRRTHQFQTIATQTFRCFQVSAPRYLSADFIRRLLRSYFISFHLFVFSITNFVNRRH